MTKREPRATVFIPAYNAARYIGEAIESVLSQSYKDFELLIVDDCSTDDTFEICRRYCDDPRVRLERMPENRGRPAVRQHGLTSARGTYYAMLDADDRCLPGRLARQVAYLDRHPSIDVLGSRWRGMDVDGRPLVANQNVGPMSPDTVTCYLLFRGIVHNPTVMARRAAMLAHGYQTGFDVAEDYDLWARMIGQHRFALLAARLTAYRIHPEQASTAREAESRARRCDIQARELKTMGMVFEPGDVKRHNLLYTGQRLFRQETGHAIDLAQVRWADDWLRRLVRANAQTARFPEPAFTRLAARLFRNVCKKAARIDGHAVWATYRASPLAAYWPRARLEDLMLSLKSRWRRNA